MYDNIINVIDDPVRFGLRMYFDEFATGRIHVVFDFKHFIFNGRFELFFYRLMK